ncbi:MAG: 30S ribosomal protein S7, partial [Nanoarchaeota archaeon]|nr:30S ribosomal protein S7 [Nanoarchaeota archaeon]
RIDVALRHMTQGVYQKSFDSKKSAVSNLVDELVNAYSKSTNSVAVSKKYEVERQCDSSR